MTKEEFNRIKEKYGVHCSKCGKLWSCGLRKLSEKEKAEWICPDCEKWFCGECGEVRREDERVANGMKCYHCAYGY